MTKVWHCGLIEIMADKKIETNGEAQKSCAMERLQKLAKENGPLCVGLDTDISYLPEKLVAQFEDPATAVFLYNKEIIKRVAAQKTACCCKVQIAYYEALGAAGIDAFAKTVQAVREAGLVAISDVKRGDIAATADAYARAHFSGAMETDIVTVNPYMGFDTLEPFTKYCDAKNGKSIFVLLRTSNSGAKDIEQQKLADGRFVYDLIGEEIQRMSKDLMSGFADCAVSPVGVVVGCTAEEDAKMLREKYADLFFLIPGYGAQGGAARVAATLLQNAGGAVNSSRAILCAWQKDEQLRENRERGMISITDMADAAGRAALAAKNDLMAAGHQLEE